MTIHFRETGGVNPARTENQNLTGSHQQSHLYRSFGKRAFDIIFVIAVGPIGLLLVTIVALLTAIGGRSPFYVQKRVGYDGRVFRMLKIQTMVADAEAVLERHLQNNPTARAEWDENQKLTNDPRITWLGDVLRRTSLDEMPQLWNVLKGDMSIVGPRPMMLDQQSLYPGRAYYELRPGITGPWQVSDRHRSSFAARANFDAEYNEGLSLKADLRILARTVGVVLRCTGR